MWIEPRTSTPGSDGGWTPISPSTTASGSSSSPLPAPALGAVRDPHHHRGTRAPRRASTWSSPMSRPPATSSPPAAPRSATCSTPGRRARSSRPMRASGSAARADERASYSSFATFHDPDGNTWLLQEVTTRLPGRIDPAETTFASVEDLARDRRAAAAHGEHEKRTGEATRTGPTGTPPTWSPSRPGRSSRRERACELTIQHSSAANATDERQRGGHVSELASSPFNTAAQRTRPTSASEEGT